MKLGILTDDTTTNEYYIKSCEDLSIDYAVVDIMSSNWIKEILNSKYDGFLVAPNSATQVKKSMFEERLYFINKIIGKPIYPSYEEVFVYESKRNMAYWLETKNIPMPKTKVFYLLEDALNYLHNEATYPLVFKPNVGSAAIGVRFIQSKREAIRLVNQVFRKGRFFNRGFTKWYKTRFGISYPIMDDKQYNNILFQEMIDVKHEWRGVKIGESYFAHKKLPNEEGLHSGSGKAEYSNPPMKVMNFLKEVCDVSDFQSMNVDFFEDIDGKFYVNELQTIFGSNIKPYQMKVDGKPGRYLYRNEQWVFEEGMFNQNNSYNLRVLDFVKQLTINSNV